VSLDVADRAGVLAAIAGEFSRNGVSIAAVRQSGGGRINGVMTESDGAARLVVVTHDAPESALAATVETLTKLDAVRGVDSVLRVEELGRTGVVG
jgi:homoserine dehydrogenase